MFRCAEHCQFRCAGGAKKDEMMLKILIAVDGSEHDHCSIDAVSKLANASVLVDAILICVRSGAHMEPLVATDHYSEVTIQKINAEQEAEQTRVLERATDYARAHGLLATETVAAYGPVSAEIIRVARERSVDIIAMGTRGMGALGNLFLGSVAQKVVHLAPVPVLLCK